MVRPAHSQPWMVAFVSDGEGLFVERQVCAGVLIDGSKVLTAAGCVIRYLLRSILYIAEMGTFAQLSFLQIISI